MKTYSKQQDTVSHVIPGNSKASQQTTIGQVLQRYKKGIVQMIRFEAGVGDAWHIHIDHMKFGNNNDSRVNFITGETTRKQFRRNLGEKINRFGLNGIVDRQDFRDCITWIKDNLN